MQSNFKVGDRIAVYGFTYDGTSCDGWKAEVFGLNGPLLKIILDGMSSYDSVHPKQCRKLVKEELRRIWMLKGASEEAMSVSNISDIWETMAPGERTEFLEVKRK